MPLRKNIGRAGTNFAAETQRQFNELRGALHTARESLTHLRRMIGVANIRQPRGRIPGSRTNSSSFLSSLGGLFGSALGDGFGETSRTSNNFYRSASQTAARLLDDAIRGQRNR